MLWVCWQCLCVVGHQDKAVHPSLQSWFQERQGYTKKPCLKLKQGRAVEAGQGDKIVGKVLTVNVVSFILPKCYIQSLLLSNCIIDRLSLFFSSFLFLPPLQKTSSFSVTPGLEYPVTQHHGFRLGYSALLSVSSPSLYVRYVEEMLRWSKLPPCAVDLEKNRN